MLPPLLFNIINTIAVTVNYYFTPHDSKRSQGVNLKTVIGRLIPVIREHVNYFRPGDLQVVYGRLECWIRMRLRCFKCSIKRRTDNRRFPIRRLRRMGLLSFEQYLLSKCTKV
ncbi:group II intron maturase-specific domain-containing protein [Candidatus Scalindua japonica]|uniref:group II intron maturase-specific domain-containing protein n=1 Tax=Candidatus Scalindua japonica TaxID=1284222 RepID=UPI000BDEC02D